MERRQTNSQNEKGNPNRQLPPQAAEQLAHIPNMPIVYHVALEEVFDTWARDMGVEPEALRETTEEVMHHDFSKAVPDLQHPHVFRLPIKDVSIFFTIEPTAVKICGYMWPEDLASSGGGYFVLTQSWWFADAEEFRSQK